MNKSKKIINTLAMCIEHCVLITKKQTGNQKNNQNENEIKLGYIAPK